MWIGVQRELVTMAHARARAFVTVERIEDTDFLRDPLLAAGTIPGLYITAIAEVAERRLAGRPRQCVSGRCAALADYAAAAATPEGFARWAATTAAEPVG